MMCAVHWKTDRINSYRAYWIKFICLDSIARRPRFFLALLSSHISKWAELARLSVNMYAEHRRTDTSCTYYPYVAVLGTMLIYLIFCACRTFYVAWDASEYHLKSKLFMRFLCVFICTQRDSTSGHVRNSNSTKHRWQYSSFNWQ